MFWTKCPPQSTTPAPLIGSNDQTAAERFSSANIKEKQRSTSEKEATIECFRAKLNFEASILKKKIQDMFNSLALK